MSSNSQQTLKNLQQAIKKDDHNEVYEYSKILLKQSPEDEDYQQCLIISALKINMLEDLEVMFKNSPSKESTKKLYAYYLYYIGDYQKAISYLQGLISKTNNASFKLLLAQSYFKINDQASSAKIMLDLVKDSSKIKKQDLQMYLVNLFSTSINKHLDENTVGKYKNIMKQNYIRQIYYNYSLLLVALEDYKTALQYLNHFQSQLKKGQDDNDIKMSQVLKDYISHKSSRKQNDFGIDMQENESRIGEYEKMQEQTGDPNLKSVIKNNKIFLKYQNNEHILQNFHQILRVIDQGLQKKTKVTKPQQFVLKLNKFTILLRKNRLVEASKLLKDLQSNYEPEVFLNHNLDFIKGKFYFLKKTKQSHKESTDLFGYVDSIAILHRNLAFCLLADLKIEDGKEKQLISELKEQNSYSSIIKNFIFSLLIKNPDLFEQYHEYLSELLQKTNDGKILDILLRLYENKQDLPKQQAVLNKILRTNPKDSQSKVKMAQIYINQGKVQEAEQLLRGVEEPEQINDINYLQHIQKNIHVSIKKDDEIERVIPSTKKGQQKQTPINSQLKRRIKKKRRPRYPRTMEKVIPAFKPDPERWLPKWQRKGFKKKGRKGAGKTQGLATVGKQQTKNVFTTNASTSAKQVTKQASKKRK